MNFNENLALKALLNEHLLYRNESNVKILSLF
jgi:hypothetical protein